MNIDTKLSYADKIYILRAAMKFSEQLRQRWGGEKSVVFIDWEELQFSASSHSALGLSKRKKEFINECWEEFLK